MIQRLKNTLISLYLRLSSPQSFYIAFIAFVLAPPLNALIVFAIFCCQMSRILVSHVILRVKLAGKTVLKVALYKHGYPAVVEDFIVEREESVEIGEIEELKQKIYAIKVTLYNHESRGDIIFFPCFSKSIHVVAHDDGVQAVKVYPIETRARRLYIAGYIVLKDDENNVIYAKVRDSGEMNLFDKQDLLAKVRVEEIREEAAKNE